MIRSGVLDLLVRGATSLHILKLCFIQHALRFLAVLHQTSHVALHLLNLAKKAIEIIVHGCQEISQRALNLLHLEFDSDDALVELLTDVCSARVILALSNEHLVCLHV